MVPEMLNISKEDFQRLTVDGLRDMIGDLRRSGHVPTAILLNEYDRREMNQDLMGVSVSEVDKKDQHPDHDGKAIGVIEGVMILSHKDIARGKARLVYNNDFLRGNSIQ